MKNNPLFLVLGMSASLMAGLFSARSQPREQPGNPTYALDVQLRCIEETNYYLDVFFTNQSPATLVFFPNFVPVGKFGMTLVAIDTDAEGTRLPCRVIGDPPLQLAVEVRSGGHLQGQIFLNKRCPMLVSALERRDVVIFWTYQPEPNSSSPLARTGGWLFLPKASSVGRREKIGR